MNKYIIRGTFAALGAILMIMLLITDYSDCTFLDRLISLAYTTLLAGCITEFCLSLICYHHALWTNQDLSEQKLPDGTK